MAHLEHVFVAGVRFDTEVQYLSRSAHGPTYRNLPVRMSASARNCALTSVLQCVAILLQMPRRQAAQRLRRVIPSAAQAIDDASLLLGFRAFGEGITAEPLPSSDAQEIGDAALGALRAGHLCMLQVESNRFCRWATVIGVELDRTTGRARTLLLLDSGVSEPWACAHNVRIELQAVAGKSVRASAGFTLNFRDLWGGACAVRLRSLIVPRRSAPGSP